MEKPLAATQREERLAEHAQRQSNMWRSLFILVHVLNYTFFSPVVTARGATVFIYKVFCLL
jgi:hypothetical protein